MGLAKKKKAKEQLIQESIKETPQKYRALKYMKRHAHYAYNPVPLSKGYIKDKTLQKHYYNHKMVTARPSSINVYMYMC